MLGTLLEVSPVREHECPDVRSIVIELDLDYAGLRLTGFWLARLDGQIVSILNLEECGPYRFISSVGTVKNQQGKGFASALLQTVLTGSSKPGCLYTIIPSFFTRLGFAITPPPDIIPSRTRFACHRCEPHRCVFMIWDSVVSKGP